MNFRFLIMLFGVLAAAPPDAENQIRGVIGDYMRAVREGGPRQLGFLSTGYRYFGAHGHIFEAPPSGDRTAARGKNRSDFVVSVYFPSPDMAIAASIWRDGSAKPPFDAGMADYTLRREKGVWKILTSRDGYLHSPESLAGVTPVAALGPDWEPLFDGKTGDGWMTVTGGAALPASWRIDAGSFVTVAGHSPMSIRTLRRFTTFELAWEWKAAAGANSGVKYRLYSVRFSADGTVGDGVGYEYQLSDDAGDPGARVDAKQRSGCLYGVTSMGKTAARAIGEWNESRVIVAADHVEHWLNGTRTAYEPIDVTFASPISLQHHSGEVRFRNMRIRGLATR